MLASTIAGLRRQCLACDHRAHQAARKPNNPAGLLWAVEGKDASTIGDPPFNSFPSGHAATAFGFAAVILYARPWLGIGAIALASLIGMVEHHGGRTPSFRCRSLRFVLSLFVALVYLEMDKRETVRPSRAGIRMKLQPTWNNARLRSKMMSSFPCRLQGYCQKWLRDSAAAALHANAFSCGDRTILKTHPRSSLRPS